MDWPRYPGVVVVATPHAARNSVPTKKDMRSISVSMPRPHKHRAVHGVRRGEARALRLDVRAHRNGVVARI